MENSLNNLLEKYLNDQCTPEELRLLLRYFEDGANEQQLKNLIAEKSRQIEINREPSFIHESAANEVYKNIHLHIQASKPKRLKSLVWSGIAAAIITGLFITGIITKYLYNGTATPQFVLTQNAQHKKVQLPDGTQVWLGPSSKLEFPESFEGATRQVKLEGEAFFEVTKDKAHPFIIKSGLLTTRVLGTSFTIKSFKVQKLITVTVLTGKVGVTAQPAGKPLLHVQLVPNQRVVYNQQEQDLKKEDYPDAKKILEERDGNYEFKGTPMAQVLEEAKRQYGVKITASNIDNCTFYGDLKAKESIEDFLKKVCLVINATWHKENNTYQINAPGC